MRPLTPRRRPVAPPWLRWVSQGAVLALLPVATAVVNPHQAAAQSGYSVALSAQGNHAAAITTIEQALRERSMSPLGRARYTVLLGEVYLAEGRSSDAADVLRTAVDELSRCGAQYWAARAFCGAHRVVLRLAVSGRAGLSAEQLADWLWPEATRDLSARVRAVLWQVRRGLGAAGGRLHRRGDRVFLDVRPEECDDLEVLARAASTEAGNPQPARDLLARTELPLLGGETYDEWSLDLRDRVEALRADLRRVTVVS